MTKQYMDAIRKAADAWRGTDTYGTAAVMIDDLLAELEKCQKSENPWHDAKTDPPKTPGLYYGKKDDTNSMWPCQYRDGIWTLDMCPNQKMPIIQWAEYTSFLPIEQSENEVVVETNEPLTLNELLKMDGEPIWIVPLGDKPDWVPHWCIFRTKYDTYATANSIKHNGRMYFLHPKEYGKTWIAYRHKQER